MRTEPPRRDDRDAEWARDNQRHLVLLAEAAANRLDGRPDDAEEPERVAALLAESTVRTTGRPPAADWLAGLFGLTRFERDTLVAAAAPDIGLPTPAGGVTFGRVLATLLEPHWSALLPDAPLRRWSLLDIPPQLPPAEFGGLAQVPLAADERIIHALVGADTLDQRLAGRARLAAATCRLTPAQEEVATTLAALAMPGSAVASVLVGEDRLTRRQAAVAAAAQLHRTVLVVDGGETPADPATAAALARMLAREAGLGARLVLVEAKDVEPAAVRLAEAVASCGVPAVIAAEEVPGDGELPVLRLPPASLRDRRSLFAAALDDTGLAADPAELAAHHPLTPAGIAMAVDRAARLATAGRTGDVAGACRAVAARPLHGLAELRRPEGRLDDLVLLEASARALRALLAHVRSREKVHGDWGYDERRRGLAVSALFAGPSGTGKTTAAEAVAAELGLDVLSADLSQVMSKYIGETEKNLARLFDAAEAGAVLVFDEGDALFGKRTQVRDSRDRYANLEISYLLQRLESFGGIAIVTTNAREAIDAAFTRRMRFVVNFPLPDAAQREELWRRALPPAVPRDGLNHGRLAQLAVSGGTIAQLAVHAAFLAADSSEPVRMHHLLEAARIECDKLDRPLSAHETRGWV